MVEVVVVLVVGVAEGVEHAARDKAPTATRTPRLKPLMGQLWTLRRRYALAPDDSAELAEYLGEESGFRAQVNKDVAECGTSAVKLDKVEELVLSLGISPRVIWRTVANNTCRSTTQRMTANDHGQTRMCHNRAMTLTSVSETPAGRLPRDSLPRWLKRSRRSVGTVVARAD